MEEGSLYPAVHRLALDGLIDSEWDESANNHRAKFYTLTARGRKATPDRNEPMEAACHGHCVRRGDGVRRLLKKPRLLGRRRRLEQDLEDELGFHLENMTR